MFGKKKPPPAEQAKEWKSKLRKEAHGIERSIQRIEQGENNLKTKMKQVGKTGDEESMMILAKQMVQSRKARSKLRGSVTQINSIMRQIDIQIAESKVTGCFKASNEVLHSMNQLIKLPEVQKVAMELGQEMEQAGLIQESVDMALDEVGDVDQDELDNEVKKAYNEIAKEVNKGQVNPKVKYLDVEEEAPMSVPSM